MLSVLIIDDEEDIRSILKYTLEKEGYMVYEASNGKDGLAQANEVKPDVIVLDVMMPDMDGIEVCENIRRNPDNNDVIICMLTARNEDYSQIAGLEAGADDYVAKPVKPKVFVSKIKALLRRKGLVFNLTNSTSGLIVNRDKYIIEKDGETIHLPRKEFELLALLASKPNHVFERDFILETVWGKDIVVGDRTIDVHVRKLREKLGSDYIITVKGIGYKFVDGD
jgi:two-component system, OmpR family, alkaline phosphatase synthesis response regulator PhoP